MEQSLQEFVNGTVSACGIQGATDGFGDYVAIDGIYVDGVSITRGSPRQHIWTYAIGLQETIPLDYPFQCPCAINTSSLKFLLPLLEVTIFVSPDVLLTLMT